MPFYGFQDLPLNKEKLVGFKPLERLKKLWRNLKNISWNVNDDISF